MYTFSTSVVHMDCFSLPNSPKEVQKLYWLCLQEHLTLANLQDPVDSFLEALETMAHRQMHSPLASRGGAAPELTAYS